jgi:hypothetical protein
MAVACGISEWEGSDMMPLLPAIRRHGNFQIFACCGYSRQFGYERFRNDPTPPTRAASHA